MPSAGRLFLIAFLPFFAFGENQRLAWNQLQEWSGSESGARIRTADGARIEARIQSVREDQLVLAILKSSDSRRYAPGEMVLNRASIRQLEVRREKPESSGGRAGFATLFGVIGALTAMGAEGDTPAAAKALVGGGFWGAIGYAIGWKVDTPPWNPVDLSRAARTSQTSDFPPERSAPGGRSFSAALPRRRLVNRRWVAAARGPLTFGRFAPFVRGTEPAAGRGDFHPC